jgi:hypothetical protein
VVQRIAKEPIYEKGVIEEMERPEAEPIEAAPKESAAAGQSASAYALVSVDNSAKLLSTYRKLYFHQNVLYCDAIRGDHDLILLLQAPTIDEINKIVKKELKTMDGVTEVSLLSVDIPTFGENVINIMGSVDRALGRDKGENTVAPNQTTRTRVSSYVMLEVEKEKMEAIYPALYFNDQVVNCDCTDGR